MSTFPGAVRASLLGDRDNTGERLAQLGLQGLTAGPEEVGLEGVRACHTDSSSCPQSAEPLLYPSEGWDSFGPIQGGGAWLSSSRLEPPGLAGKGTHMHTFHTGGSHHGVPCERSLLGSTNTLTVMLIYGQTFCSLLYSLNI